MTKPWSDGLIPIVVAGIGQLLVVVCVSWLVQGRLRDLWLLYLVRSAATPSITPSASRGGRRSASVLPAAEEILPVRGDRGLLSGRNRGGKRQLVRHRHRRGKIRHRAE